MVKVDNAIILAAGMGTRMIPLTYDIPKGLITVRGESLVERQIRQLLEKDIKDIILVTGYRHEDFQGLAKKYAGIVKIVYNPHYDSKNNIYSLYLVREDLKNSYILSADNYYTENIFQSEEDASWYCAITDDEPRNEWGMVLDPLGRIIDIKKTAQAGQPFMYGAVYFNKDFSKKFKLILEKEYSNPETHGFLWEEILNRHISELEIKANIKSKDVVHEIESFEELRTFDFNYQKTSGNPLLQIIADVFQVGEMDINGIAPQKLGLTNDSFLFRIRGKCYIFRLPGKGSQQFIDRKKECEIYQSLKPMNLSDQVIYFDPDTGIKISVYEENSRVLNAGRDKAELKKAVQFLKRVHQSEIQVDENFGLESCHRYEKIWQKNSSFFEDYYSIKQRLEKLESFLITQGITKTLCHTDFIQENILILKNQEIRLIDWEYAAMADSMVDLAVFIICSWQGEEELREMASYYFERELTALEWIRLYNAMALSAFAWSTWTKLKEFQGYVFTDQNYFEKLHAYINPYLEKAEEQMEKYNG